MPSASTRTSRRRPDSTVEARQIASLPPRGTSARLGSHPRPSLALSPVLALRLRGGEPGQLGGSLSGSELAGADLLGEGWEQALHPRGLAQGGHELTLSEVPHPADPLVAAAHRPLAGGAPRLGVGLELCPELA